MEEVPSLYVRCIICNKKLVDGVVHKCSERDIARYDAYLAKLDYEPEVEPTFNERIRDGFRIK